MFTLLAMLTITSVNTNANTGCEAQLVSNPIFKSSLAIDTVDTIQVYPSADWTTVNGAGLTVTDDFSYLTISSDPSVKTTGIRKNLGINLGMYKRIILNVVIDTMSTFVSTGTYPNASPWSIEIMSFSTFETFSTLLKQGLNSIELKKKVNYFDSWNGIQISSYFINKSYPKFIKIRSIELVGIYDLSYLINGQ